MSDIPTPPRGSGRHLRRDPDVPPSYRRDRSGAGETFASPGGDYPGEPGSVVDSNPGLYRVPVPGDPGYDSTEPAHNLGPGIREMNRRRADRERDGRTDFVVPRIYLEPDEVMDRLRARALRVGMVRDMVIIGLALSLTWRWIVLPLWQVLGG